VLAIVISRILWKSIVKMHEILSSVPTNSSLRTIIAHIAVLTSEYCWHDLVLFKVAVPVRTYFVYLYLTFTDELFPYL
jgi:hypothetical protein